MSIYLVNPQIKKIYSEWDPGAQSLSICAHFNLRLSHSKLHGDISLPHPAVCHSHYITCKTSPDTARLYESDFFSLFLPLFCFVNHFWNSKTPLMHRWNGCICGEDAAGCFLHCDRREQITAKKKCSARFLNRDDLSCLYEGAISLIHHNVVRHCLFTFGLQTKRFNIKSFLEGRVSRWGHVEGGDYETSVACMARTVTSFVKWRLTSDPCTSDEAEERPLSAMEVDRRY